MAESMTLDPGGGRRSRPYARRDPEVERGEKRAGDTEEGEEAVEKFGEGGGMQGCEGALAMRGRNKRKVKRNGAAVGALHA